MIYFDIIALIVLMEVVHVCFLKYDPYSNYSLDIPGTFISEIKHIIFHYLHRIPPTLFSAAVPVYYI